MAVIVTAMVSVSFGSYGSALFFGGSVGWAKVLTTAVVLVITVVGIAGASSSTVLWSDTLGAVPS